MVRLAISGCILCRRVILQRRSSGAQRADEFMMSMYFVVRCPTVEESEAILAEL